MTRRTIVLVVLASVVLAGCAGTQGTGTPTADTPTEGASGVEIDEIPGVSNGTVTDATALAEANGATIAETGGRIRIVQTGPDGERETLLTVGSNGASVFSTTSSSSAGQSETLDYYSNDTATYVRMQSGGETRYRVVEQEENTLDRFNSSLETYLAAGTFTATNDSTDPTTAVFTADEFSALEDGGLFSDASSISGRLVLSQAGQVQNLTITGQQGDQTVTFTYELQQPIIERASAPAWVGDIPPSAALQPELSVDVESDSYLRIQHDGGDAVPRNATLAVAANNTSGTVTFDSALDSGETRYAYFAASDGSLVLTAEEPASDVTSSIDSPASVTISTDDGTTLYSVSMGWGSESASEGTASGSSGSSGDQ